MTRGGPGRGRGALITRGATRGRGAPSPGRGGIITPIRPPNTQTRRRQLHPILNEIIPLPDTNVREIDISRRVLLFPYNADSKTPPKFYIYNDYCTWYSYRLEADKKKDPLPEWKRFIDPTRNSRNVFHNFTNTIQSIRKQYKADVVGISGQGAESKQKFASELGLDFSILADEGDAVRKAFSVPKAAFGFLPGRVTYVLDKNGVCTSVYDNLTDAASHIQAAKEALEEMTPAKAATGAFKFPF